MAHSGQTGEDAQTGGRVKWHLTAADTGGRLLRGEYTGGRLALLEHTIPPLAGGGARDVAAHGALQARYSLAMDPDSIGPLMARHRLER